VTWKVLQASDFGVAQIRRRIYIVGSRLSKIDLDNFPKTTVLFGEIKENNIPCLETDFAKAVKEYLQKNNLPLSHLYDKSIRDKRGKENNLHSWHLELRGETTQSQCDLLEKMVTERRNKQLAKKKGVPLKDGVGLDFDEMLNLYNGTDLRADIEYLIEKGYLKRQTIPTYNKEIYDIVCGRLSFPITKFLDPNKFALTLVATDAIHTGVVEENGIRHLTTKECMRLNGLPDTYKMNVEYKKALDLLGNSVVVPVIEAICNRIFTNDSITG
jgi:DNA (cytosine-5)-methyltransferase 1